MIYLGLANRNKHIWILVFNFNLNITFNPPLLEAINDLKNNANAP